MKTYNQVILNENGNSWINIHISSKKMDETLKELLGIVIYYKNNPDKLDIEWRNQIWVVDFDGSVRAAQKSLELALRYYKEDRILVHSNQTFY